MRFLPFLLSLVTLAVSLPLEIRDNIPMPQDDPFYTPPAGYESAKVGDILASRSVKIAAFSKLPQNLKAAYQLLYRTVDINGNPAATVQTVMVPYNARKGPMRILSYQAAEDSVSLHCAPSYQFQLDTVGDNGSMQLEIINIDHALGSGYITLVPDYEGLSSAFTVGPLAATGVLDGIRAALNFQTVIPNKTDTQLAMLGYSGGGLATAWASQLASTYAPELTFVGVAEGGVPVNLENSIDQVNKGQNAGEIASALVGVSQVYPDVQKYIADHLYPNGTEAFAKVKDQCIGKDLTQFQNQDIFSYFTVTEDEFKAADPIRKVFNATLLGQPGSPLPQMPLYIYHSVNDEIVNGADEDDYVNNLCTRGIKSLHSERELVGGHISLAVTGDAQAFNFLEDRFNGKPPVPGCTIVNTTTSLADPLNAVVFGATLLDFLKGLLGLPIAYLGPA